MVRHKLTELLAASPIVTAAELRAAGVSGRDVSGAVERVDIVRAAHGLYATMEVYADPDFDHALACHRTGGVIAHLSAGQRQGLCDAVPPLTELIVPHTLTRAPDGLPLRLMRTRSSEAMSVGVEATPFHGLELRVTGPARTVVDLHRIEPAATRQHAVTALARYVTDGGSVDDLHRVAVVFDCWDTLRPEVEIALESRGGMKP